MIPAKIIVSNKIDIDNLSDAELELMNVYIRKLTDIDYLDSHFDDFVEDEIIEKISYMFNLKHLTSDESILVNMYLNIISDVEIIVVDDYDFSKEITIMDKVIADYNPDNLTKIEKIMIPLCGRKLRQYVNEELEYSKLIN